jgi:glycosyltransferase involved in cell wall biosynthesis
LRKCHWQGYPISSNADAYLCTSDHEGFCVPIVESFRIGLAVETNDPSYLADVLRVVATDAELRGELIDV